MSSKFSFWGGELYRRTRDPGADRRWRAISRRGDALVDPEPRGPSRHLAGRRRGAAGMDLDARIRRSRL